MASLILSRKGTAVAIYFGRAIFNAADMSFVVDEVLIGLRQKLIIWYLQSQAMSTSVHTK